MKGMGLIQGIKKIKVELSSTSRGVIYNEVELSSTYSLHKNTSGGTRNKVQSINPENCLIDNSMSLQQLFFSHTI